MRDPVVEVILQELGVQTREQLPALVAVVDDAQLVFARAFAQLPGVANGHIRVFSDAGVADSALDAVRDAGIEVVSQLDAGLFTGAQLVIGWLPKSLAELEEIAQLVALQAAPEVRVLLAEREKYLNRSMNTQLARYFLRVRATRGLRKARALVAQEPLPQVAQSFPKSARIAQLGLTVCAHGGAFAGASYDIGTRALIEAVEAAGLPEATIAVDLGCGTGILAAWLARSLPRAQVIATDRSWAACASAQATAAANGVAARVRVLRGNVGEGIPDASVDLVVLNPPFHEGHRVQQGMANELFRAAARMLRPGGVLITVFNSHLRHRQQLERLVGSTRQLARTAKFTVTQTTR